MCHSLLQRQDVLTTIVAFSSPPGGSLSAVLLHLKVVLGGALNLNAHGAP